MEETSILVVDDDRDVLEMADCFFREAGLEVHCAESGSHALEKILGTRFTVMLTDYNMPEMNGLELAIKAKEIAPRLHIVMATGHPSRELSELAAKAGIAEVLAKPLHMEDILKLVCEIIPPISF